MSRYKRLTEKEKNKMLFMRKVKNFIIKNFKILSVLLGIFLLCAIAAVSFYFCIDGNGNNVYDAVAERINNAKSKNQNNDNLTQLGKQELERESEKEKKLDEKIDSSEKSGDKIKKGYDFSKWNKECAPELMVINKNNYISDDFNVQTKTCRGKEVAVIVCEPLENMIEDAKKEKIRLWISSGYRSLKLQKKLFDRQVEREKSKEIISQEEAEMRAATVVARPGTSEHNTGLAIDFNGVEDNFFNTEEYKWLIEHCAEYGFIERYRKGDEEKTGVIYEPWHFRYVGKENAQKIKESGLCLEEYVEKNLINSKNVKGENKL